MLRRRLKTLLTGNSFPQEYLCLKKNTEDLLEIYVDDGEASTNVSESHLLLGYQPLIIGIPALQNAPMKDTLKLNFTFDNDVVGYIALRKQTEIELDSHNLILYQGEFGKHRLLNSFHRFMNRNIEKWREKGKSNANLSGNRYEQVRLAYSYPRTIAVASIQEGELMNLFPTDLHGSVQERYYLDSLRIGALACQQVERVRRMVVSEVNLSTATEVYRMGKNHMKSWQPSSHFSLLSSKSERLQFPLWRGTIRYKELVWLKSVDVGIHRVHAFEIIHRENLANDAEVLSHVHKYYGAWRDSHFLKTDYVLR